VEDGAAGGVCEGGHGAIEGGHVIHLSG
jgi:hypothetical protein